MQGCDSIMHCGWGCGYRARDVKKLCKLRCIGPCEDVLGPCDLVTY